MLMREGNSKLLLPLSYDLGFCPKTLNYDLSQAYVKLCFGNLELFPINKCNVGLLTYIISEQHILFLVKIQNLLATLHRNAICTLAFKINRILTLPMYLSPVNFLEIWRTLTFQTIDHRDISELSKM